MFTNPFNTVFGGKPELFFGRREIRTRFDIALVDPRSEDRALFITGTRGSGKTTLLEHLSRRASSKHWKVIDLGPDQTVRALLRAIEPYDEKSRTVSPQVSISVLGSGGSASGGSSSKVAHLTEADLVASFTRFCARHSKGVMVTIDEVQKVSKEECSLICNAFQMASRKGHNVILLLAGLPYSHDKVISYPGCTYMRRAVHEELGLLTRKEAEDALGRAFRDNPGLSTDEEEREQLVSASFGHPYLIQLLGYHLILTVNQNSPRGRHRVTPAEVAETKRLAIAAYNARALRPMVAEMTESERAYATALAKALDEDRTASTAEVARLMGKNPSSVSYLRESLLGDGIILAPARGRLMFNIPYLASYLQEPDEVSDNVERALSWGV